MNLFSVCSNELVIASGSASIIEIANQMRDKHVGCVVVMSDTQPRRPVGIITDRDIVIRVMAFADRRTIVSVDQVMSRSLAMLPGTTGIHDALELMRERGVRRLLVMNDNGNPKGIVSFDDLLLAMSQEMNTMAQAIVTSVLREEKGSTP